ncbi:TIGR00730 family Rossman fold protein [Candidatus Zinderia endosymbiont of Aphrophora alni]|uniref:LOG family protein n=1 Tax=Candidatus Zinderia endosymbiont of Aphrophora alni TaxID=3077951 RepID=UPI0030CA86DA
MFKLLINNFFKKYVNDIYYLINLILDFLKSKFNLLNLKFVISIFGSSRIKKNNLYYLTCLKLSKLLVNSGFKIFTGGGLGIMEAANKGAFNLKKISSIGLNFEFLNNIKNNFQNMSIDYNFLFMRKNSFYKYSKAYIIFPGGLGTIDEFTEILNLLQMNMIRKVPVILVGSSFWSGFIDWMNNIMIKNNFINTKDLKLFKIIDEPIKILNFIKNFYKKK